MTATDTLAQRVLAQRVLAAAAAQGLQVAPIPTADGAAAHMVRVVNQSPNDLKMLVSRTQGDEAGRNTWQTLARGESKTITSSTSAAWETIQLHDAQGRCAAVHVPTGFEITVTESLPAELYVPASFRVAAITDESKAKSAIVFENKATKPVAVFVTPFVNLGADEWYKVASNSQDTCQWHRTEPQVVVVQGQDGVRDAVFFKPGSTVTYVGIPAPAKSGPRRRMLVNYQDGKMVYSQQEHEDVLWVGGHAFGETWRDKHYAAPNENQFSSADRAMWWQR
ncbi:hypothetical protein GGF32_000275 [Allomyces javanicus]|nr:hypothetical protein GGF32_000275 [Allomyces javanicus]